MVDEKRKSAAEFLRAQQEREQQELSDAALATKEQQAQEAKGRDEKHAAIAKRILSDWRETVTNAAKEKGIRFAVLADLSDVQSWEHDPHVCQILDAIRAEEWSAEVVRLTPPQVTRLNAHLVKPNEAQVGEVAYKNERGWRFDGTPKFGEHFFTQRGAVIVKWSAT